MADFSRAGPQFLAEVGEYFFTFAPLMAGGVTMTGVTATHHPPSGTASTPVVHYQAAGTGDIQLGPLSAAGWHTVDLQATLSDGAKPELRLVILALE